MKKLFYIFILLSLFSCNKDDNDVNVTLEDNVIGKWVAYVATDVNNSNVIAGFEFKNDGTLNLYSGNNFSADKKIMEFKWSVKPNNKIEIVLQGDPIMAQGDPIMAQGDPIMFPNGVQQGDPIMIFVDSWKQGDPIMHIFIYGKLFKLVKVS